MVTAARRRLPAVHFALDGALWVVSIPLAVVLQGVGGLASGMYRRRWRYGSFDEMRMVAVTAASVGVVLTVGLWQWHGIPRSVSLLATGLSLLGQITARSLWRLRNEHRNRPNGARLQRLLVVGAGEGGDQMLRTLLGSSDSSYLPVVLLDDDPHKRSLRLSGVRVEGRVDDLAAVARRYQVNAVLIAVPSVDSSLIRRVSDLAAESNLKVLVLPPVDHLLGGVGESDIRPFNELDLLDRHPARFEEVFAEVRPEVVFHAALKHLPLLEMYPDGGWKSNVCGTLNLLNAARRYGAMDTLSLAVGGDTGHSTIDRCGRCPRGRRDSVAGRRPARRAGDRSGCPVPPRSGGRRGGASHLAHRSSRRNAMNLTVMWSIVDRRQRLERTTRTGRGVHGGLDRLDADGGDELGLGPGAPPTVRR